MSNYGAMQNRIAFEVRGETTAAATGLTTQIKNAIQTAIAYYQNERLWFNEEADTSTTSSGTQTYSLPSDFIQFDAIRIAESGGSIYLANPAPFETVLTLTTDTSYTGRPQDYAIHGDLLYFWPIPDDTYTYYRYYLKSLSSLSSDSDTNAWMTHGEELIRMRAERELWMNVIHSPEMAVGAAAAEEAALARLRERTQQQIASGRIVGDWF